MGVNAGLFLYISELYSNFRFDHVRRTVVQKAGVPDVSIQATENVWIKNKFNFDQIKNYFLEFTNRSYFGDINFR